MTSLLTKNRQNRGDWLTNNMKTIHSWWPRRGVKMVQGPPKETTKYTVEDFEKMGMIGIYLDEDLENSWESYPMCKNPKEWNKVVENRNNNNIKTRKYEFYRIRNKCH